MSLLTGHIDYDPSVTGLTGAVDDTILSTAYDYLRKYVKYGTGDTEWVVTRLDPPTTDDGLVRITYDPRVYGLAAADLSYCVYVPPGTPASEEVRLQKVGTADTEWARVVRYNVPAPGAGGGSAVTATTVNLGALPRTRHEVSVTDGTITAGQRVVVTHGAWVDTDENDPEMDIVTFSARTPSPGSFLLLATGPVPFAGTWRINYLVGA